MVEEWLLDGRKIPDGVMNYLRKLAVHAIRARGQSPEVVAQVLNISRSSLYRWLKQYDEGGLSAVETRLAPGAPLVVTQEMDDWLKESVLTKTPVEFG